MTNRPKEYVPKALRLGDPPKWRGNREPMYAASLDQTSNGYIEGPVPRLEDILELVPPSRGACIFQLEPAADGKVARELLYTWDGGKWVMAPGKE